jgi:hypothetical protein
MTTRFQRARVGATDYNPAPVAVPGDAIPPPQIDTGDKARLIQNVRIADNVRELAEEGRSFTETVILTGNRNNPWDEPLAPSVPVISFRVPNARALWVDRLGWRFTDPFMHELFSNNLEIHVNGQRLPWYRDGGVDVDPVGPPVPVAGASLSPVGFQYPFGSIAEPMPISTIYVDSGSLFEVRLVGGGDYVGVSVRVIGRLRKVAGGMT